MENPDAPETLLLRPNQITALVVCGTAALLVIFILLASVRLWASRYQKRPGTCGGLDIENLRRLRDAGEITAAEFDAVCGAAGGPTLSPPAARAVPAPETPIEPEDTGPGPERSSSDG